MLNSWSIILIVGLAAASVLFLYMQRKRSHSQHRDVSSNEAREAWESTNRDFPKEREASRLAHMSDDDRAWETATLQRSRDNQAHAAEPVR